MPKILRKFKNGYNYDNDIKKTSKELEEMVKANFKKKDEQLIKEDKKLEGGIKHSMKKFDKKIREKINEKTFLLL